jgi:hypothetical protein
LSKKKCGTSLAQDWHSKIFFVNFEIVRISKSMNNYVYQIQGALENAAGKLKGLRVLVCDLYNFDQADVPIRILDTDTIKYLEYRFKLTDDALNIQRLPFKIQDKIRVPLGIWLDHWVLKNFYGDTSNRKSSDSGLLENGGGHPAG